jgi:hypothetical protein
MYNRFFTSGLTGITNACVIVFYAAIVYSTTAMMPARAANNSDNSDNYWVVGSFKTRLHADVERERIERLTAEHIEMAAFYLDGRSTEVSADQPRAYRDGEANIRLLVRQTMEPLTQRQELELKGLAVWRLTVASRQITQFKNAVAAREEILTPEYWLVLGSFYGPDRARDQRDSLLKAGIDSVTLHRLEADGRYYFRVDHGPFDRIIAAQRQRFVDQGITGAFWTRAHGAELVDVE